MQSLLNYLVLVTIGAVLTGGCGTSSPVSEKKQAEPEAAVQGLFYLPDGESPAPGVTVVLVPADAQANIHGSSKCKITRQTVQTDNEGRYCFNTCLAGEYIIEGSDKYGNAARVDSIVVADLGMATKVDTRVLKEVGQIQGTVTLDNHGDPANIFVLALGSDRFARVNNEGDFILKDMAYGRYTLKIICIAEECYETVSLSATIVPGTIQNLDTITMKTEMVDIPREVSVTLDSVLMKVTITWEPCKSRMIKGYTVFMYDKKYRESFPQQGYELPANICIYSLENACGYDTMVFAVAAVGNNNEVGEMVGPFTVIPKPGGYPIDSITTEHDFDFCFWDSENDLIVVDTSADSVIIMSIDEYDLNKRYRMADKMNGKYTEPFMIQNKLYIQYRETDSIEGYETDGDTICKMSDGKADGSISIFPEQLSNGFYRYGITGSDNHTYRSSAYGCGYGVSVKEFNEAAVLCDSFVIPTPYWALGASGPGCPGSPDLYCTNGELYGFCYGYALRMLRRSGEEVYNYPLVEPNDKSFDIAISRDGLIGVVNGSTVLILKPDLSPVQVNK